MKPEPSREPPARARAGLSLPRTRPRPPPLARVALAGRCAARAACGGARSPTLQQICPHDPCPTQIGRDSGRSDSSATAFNHLPCTVIII